jgi:hypothetical protein
MEQNEGFSPIYEGNGVHRAIISLCDTGRPQ